MDKDLAQNILQQVKENYNLCAADFSQTRSYNWQEIKSLAEKYIKEGMKILDVGCGNGRLFELVKNKNVKYFGIDNSEKLIEEAKRLHNKSGTVNFSVGDILSLPQSDNEFDAIFCIAVLHHIPSKELREKAISQMYRILKPGGILIMSLWNLYQKKYRHYLYKFTIDKLLLKNKMDFGDIMLAPFGGKGQPRFHHVFTKREIASLFKKNGFSVEEAYYEKKGEKKGRLEGANLIIVGEKKI